MTKIQSILLFIAAAIIFAAAMVLTNPVQAEVTCKVPLKVGQSTTIAFPPVAQGVTVSVLPPPPLTTQAERLENDCEGERAWEFPCRQEICPEVRFDDGTVVSLRCEWQTFPGTRGCHIGRISGEPVGYVCESSGRKRVYCGRCPPGTSPSPTIE